MRWPAAMRRIQWSDLIVMVSFFGGAKRPHKTKSSAFFYDDLRKQAAAIPRAPCEPAGRAPGGIEIGPRARRIGCSDHRRVAAVRFLADLRVERQLPEQRHPILLRHPLAAPGAEDVFGMTAV